MNLTRRWFLKGAAAVAVAPMIPSSEFSSSDASALMASGPIKIAPGVMVTGSVPKLLQAGVKDLFEKEYAKYGWQSYGMNWKAGKLGVIE